MAYDPNQIIYTDPTSGKGYTYAQLQSANADPTFAAQNSNASGVLQSYGSAANAAAAPAPAQFVTTPGGTGSEATTNQIVPTGNEAISSGAAGGTTAGSTIPYTAPQTSNVGAGVPSTNPYVAAPGQQTALKSSAQGYNALTGASATFDPASGMWVDTNGVQIRPDAIRIVGGWQSQQLNAPSTTASGGASVGGAATAGPSSAFNDQVRQILMQQLAAAGTPVDENSPEIASTMEAARNEATRASDAERTGLAERLYAQGGLNTNALTQQIQQSGEKNAQALGGLKATLLMNQYNQKRQQLQQDLQLALASGDSESARQIQLAISNLNAAVQRENLGVNLAEFGASLNQNAALAGLNG